ncbi:hypothetical protein HDU96_003547 [Phlyctochytrium bullatum]|nr:hypothetical protein HDU96_003547 [Phlyctochytrium bullatum]
MPGSHPGRDPEEMRIDELRRIASPSKKDEADHYRVVDVVDRVYFDIVNERRQRRSRGAVGIFFENNTQLDKIHAVDYMPGPATSVKLSLESKDAGQEFIPDLIEISTVSAAKEVHPSDISRIIVPRQNKKQTEEIESRLGDAKNLGTGSADKSTSKIKSRVEQKRDGRLSPKSLSERYFSSHRLAYTTMRMIAELNYLDTVTLAVEQVQELELSRTAAIAAQESSTLSTSSADLGRVTGPNMADSTIRKENVLASALREIELKDAVVQTRASLSDMDANSKGLRYSLAREEESGRQLAEEITGPSDVPWAHRHAKQDDKDENARWGALADREPSLAPNPVMIIPDNSGGVAGHLLEEEIEKSKQLEVRIGHLLAELESKRSRYKMQLKDRNAALMREEMAIQNELLSLESFMTDVENKDQSRTVGLLARKGELDTDTTPGSAQQDLILLGSRMQQQEANPVLPDFVPTGALPVSTVKELPTFVGKQEFSVINEEMTIEAKEVIGLRHQNIPEGILRNGDLVSEVTAGIRDEDEKSNVPRLAQASNGSLLCSQDPSHSSDAEAISFQFTDEDEGCAESTSEEPQKLVEKEIFVRDEVAINVVAKDTSSAVQSLTSHGDVGTPIKEKPFTSEVDEVIYPSSSDPMSTTASEALRNPETTPTEDSGEGGSADSQNNSSILQTSASSTSKSLRESSDHFTPEAEAGSHARSADEIQEELMAVDTRSSVSQVKTQSLLSRFEVEDGEPIETDIGTISSQDSGSIASARVEDNGVRVEAVMESVISAEAGSEKSQIVEMLESNLQSETGNRSVTEEIEYSKSFEEDESDAKSLLEVASQAIDQYILPILSDDYIIQPVEEDLVSGNALAAEIESIVEEVCVKSITEEAIMSANDSSWIKAQAEKVDSPREVTSTGLEDKSVFDEPIESDELVSDFSASSVLDEKLVGRAVDTDLVAQHILDNMVAESTEVMEQIRRQKSLAKESSVALVARLDPDIIEPSPAASTNESIKLDTKSDLCNSVQNQSDTPTVPQDTTAKSTVVEDLTDSILKSFLNETLALVNVKVKNPAPSDDGPIMSVAPAADVCEVVVSNKGSHAESTSPAPPSTAFNLETFQSLRTSSFSNATSSQFALQFVTFILDTLPPPPTSLAPSCAPQKTVPSLKDLAVLGRSLRMKQGYTRKPTLPEALLEEMCKGLPEFIQFRFRLLFDATEEALGVIFAEHEARAIEEETYKSSRTATGDPARDSLNGASYPEDVIDIVWLNKKASVRPFRTSLSKGLRTLGLEPRPMSLPEIREAVLEYVKEWSEYSEVHGENLDALLIKEVRADERLWTDLADIERELAEECLEHVYGAVVDETLSECSWTVRRKRGTALSVGVLGSLPTEDLS